MDKTIVLATIGILLVVCTVGFVIAEWFLTSNSITVNVSTASLSLTVNGDDVGPVSAEVGDTLTIVVTLGNVSSIDNQSISLKKDGTIIDTQNTNPSGVATFSYVVTLADSDKSFVFSATA